MPRVHPRVIWIGVGLAVLGMVVAMLAMTYLDTRWWLWVGLAIVGGGVALGWAFGLMRDVRMRPHGASVEASEVIHGESHRGVSPLSSVETSSPPPPAPASVNAGAAEGARPPPVPTPKRIQWAGLAMALLGGWMVVAPLLLFYPNTEMTNDVILRDYGFAVTLVVFGLLLRNPVRHAAVVAVPALLAAALLLTVATSEPLNVRATVNEAAAGIVTLGLCAAHIFLRASVAPAQRPR
jgi:hypothetical protein